MVPFLEGGKGAGHPFGSNSSLDPSLHTVFLSSSQALTSSNADLSSLRLAFFLPQKGRRSFREEEPSSWGDEFHSFYPLLSTPFPFEVDEHILCAKRSCPMSSLADRGATSVDGRAPGVALLMRLMTFWNWVSMILCPFHVTSDPYTRAELIIASWRYLADMGGTPYLLAMAMACFRRPEVSDGVSSPSRVLYVRTHKET